MARIKPVDLNQAEEGQKLAFETHQKKYKSRITNMKATLGISLPAFHAYMEWYPLYEEIKEITGERLAYLYAYSISQATDCPLCSTFFRKIIIDKGESPEHFSTSEEEQALLNFGNAIARNKGNVVDHLFDKLRELYTDKELVLLIAFAGQMIATNIFNNVIETDIDDYLTDYLPVPNHKYHEQKTGR